MPNNGQSSGEFDQSLLTYATTFDPWITELQNSNCLSQAANYQIVNADPYFSSTLGSRPVNGNGLNGKELMRELLCTYPEQSVQSLPTNTLWAAAVEAADAEVGGMATTAQVWEVFAAYYVQQKRRVMDLQKKNPCDSDKYSPFLFDASTANNAADLVADLPREHAFNYWGNSTYDVGSGTQPATGLHPVYDNWDQSCAIQTSSIAQVGTLLSNWSYGGNGQLRVTDGRARGWWRWQTLLGSTPRPLHTRTSPRNPSSLARSMGTSVHISSTACGSVRHTGRLLLTRLLISPVLLMTSSSRRRMARSAPVNSAPGCWRRVWGARGRGSSGRPRRGCTSCASGAPRRALRSTRRRLTGA